MSDCQTCGQNHYDTSRPMTPPCPFKPFAFGPANLEPNLDAAGRLQTGLGVAPSDRQLEIRERFALARSRMHIMFAVQWIGFGLFCIGLIYLINWMMQ